MRILKLVSKMGCEYKLGEDHYCETEARYEVEDDDGKHHVYCNKHAFENVFPNLKHTKEPFFDGKNFFTPPKIGFDEKILYMPVFLIVVIVKWIIKLRKI